MLKTAQVFHLLKIAKVFHLLKTAEVFHLLKTVEALLLICFQHIVMLKTAKFSLFPKKNC